MSMPAPLTPQDARTQRHLDVLDLLIEQGIDLATRLHAQSTTPSDLCSAIAAPGIAIPFITPDVIACTAQINQTIRRAILVSKKLAEPPAPSRPITRQAQGQDHVQNGPEPTRNEIIRSGSADRVQSPDLEDRIGNRPTPELIAGLYRDLATARAAIQIEPLPNAPQPPAPPTEPLRSSHPRIDRSHDDADDEAAAKVLQLDRKPERRPPKP